MRISSVDIERSCCWHDYRPDSELKITFEGNHLETYQIYDDIRKGKEVVLDCSLSSARRKNPKLDDTKVIYQDDVTVLKTNGKVYTAKPEKGEKFDKEKGLLICLVKALGLTTSDVLKLVDKAEVKKSKGKANIIKQDKINKKRK